MGSLPTSLVSMCPGIACGQVRSHPQVRAAMPVRAPATWVFFQIRYRDEDSQLHQRGGKAPHLSYVSQTSPAKFSLPENTDRFSVLCDAALRRKGRKTQVTLNMFVARPLHGCLPLPGAERHQLPLPASLIRLAPFCSDPPAPLCRLPFMSTQHTKEQGLAWGSRGWSLAKECLNRVTGVFWGWSEGPRNPGQHKDVGQHSPRLEALQPSKHGEERRRMGFSSDHSHDELHVGSRQMSERRKSAFLPIPPFVYAFSLLS